MSTRLERLNRLKQGEEARQRVLSGQNSRPLQAQEPQQSSRLRALSTFDAQAAERSNHENAMRAGSAQARQSAEANQAEFVRQQSRANKQAFDAAGLGFGGSQFNQHMDAIKSVADHAAQPRLAEEAAKAKLQATRQAGYDSEPWGIRNVHKLLDQFSDTKPAKLVADVGMEFYTPGAGLSVLQGATEGASALVSKAAPWLGKGIAGKVAKTAITEAAVGVPAGVGNQLAKDPQSSGQQLFDAGLYGAGGGAVLGGAGSLAKGIGQKGVKSLTNKLTDIKAKQAEAIIRAMTTDNPTLALPEPQPVAARIRGNANAAQTPDVIHGPGQVKQFALPSGEPLKRTRYTVADNNQTLNRVMTEIKPEVMSIITPPTRRDQLINYIQRNMDIPVHEVWNMPIKDLQQLGDSIRQSMDIPKIAVEVARKRGYDLPTLLDGGAPNVGQRVTQDAQARAYGVYPDTLPNVRTPQFSRQVTGQVDLMTRVGRAPVAPAGQPIVQAGATPTLKVANTAEAPRLNVQTAARPAEVTASQPVREAAVSAAEVKPTRVSISQSGSDELGFSQTVKNSPATDPELLRVMNENPMTGGRTTNTLNQQAAQALIQRHGIEKLTNMLVGKKGTLSATENTAAQMLAKHYSNLGGDENLAKSIDIITKTAKSGRELGQAIQALSQWNKLDAEGVIMLAERQLNRRVSNVEDMAKLTVDQAKPLQEVGHNLESVQQAKNLVDEVVKMLANRTPNTPFNEAEKSLIQHLNAQVNKLDAEVKPLKKQQAATREKTIKEVGAIKPKDRTRDQVVNYLDAQAARAREKLKQQRNVGIIANSDNPIVLHAIIGADYLAKRVVKFADWSEAMIKEGITEGLPNIYTKAVQQFRKENGLPTTDELDKVVSKAIKSNKIDSQTADNLRVVVNEIGFYADDVKKELTRDLQLTLRQLGTSTFGEKLAATQTGAMLLNIPTFLRNAIGNVEQLTIEKMNKIAAVPIDWTLSKFTGERTIQFFPHNQESFWRNFAVGTKSGWDGVSPTGTLSSYDVHPEAFKGKYNPLRYLVKSTGASLQGMDFAGYNSAYGDVLATYAEQLGKAQNLTRQQIKQQMPELLKQLDDRVYQLSDEAGLYATYQDETLLSKAAQKVKGGLNAITDVPFKAARERGLISEGASLEGFGLGDLVLKFTRTPANLVMRGIDYSPLGFARGIFELAPLVLGKTQRFNQFAATRSISRAITGTLGFTGLGFIMAKHGILTGASSSDADKRSIQEQSGQGAYKVNLSAMKRWFMSGFDEGSAKFQRGDKLMDYAWMQPVAISLGMGVNAAEAMDKPMKPGEVRSNYDVAWKAVTGGLRTVLENPMVTGLTNVVDATTSAIKYQDASKFGDLVKGVPASFVPAVSNQARTSTDNYQRETFDSNLLTNMLNLVKNKIPGLSKSLPVSYDSLGKPRERIQSGEANTLGQYLNSFLNPAKITAFEVTPEAKLVLDVLNESGDQSVLPRIGSKYLQVDKKAEGIKNKRMDLNGQQFSQLQQRMGEMVAQEIQKQSAYLSNSSIDAEKKAKKIKDILTKVGSKARNDVRVEVGYDKKK